MDTITAAALSVDVPELHQIGLLLDDTLVFAGLLLLAIIIGESRPRKRMKIVAAVALAIIAAFLIKGALGRERPCAGESWCPADYSFPSIHASAAFALMCGFLGKRSFPGYLLFALFTAFTRLNIGVHTFVDIAAALPIAMVCYYAVHLGDADG